MTHGTINKTDLWLSLLIGLLTAISLSHIPSGIFVSVFVYSILKYFEDKAFEHGTRGNETMVRLPVQAL